MSTRKELIWTICCNVKIADNVDLQEVFTLLNEIGLHPHPSLGDNIMQYKWNEIYVNRGMYSLLPIGYEEEINNSKDFGTDINAFISYIYKL